VLEYKKGPGKLIRQLKNQTASTSKNYFNEPELSGARKFSVLHMASMQLAKRPYHNNIII